MYAHGLPGSSETRCQTYYGIVPLSSITIKKNDMMTGLCCPGLSPYIGLLQVGNLYKDHYIYMGDLIALEATATGCGPTSFRPATPLSISAWQQALLTHPDQSFVQYILSGIRVGFHIGADRASLSLRPGPGNLPSVLQHPQLVEAHIAEEVAACRFLGPIPQHLAVHCHSSPIGLIPKSNQPGK